MLMMIREIVITGKVREGMLSRKGIMIPALILLLVPVAFAADAQQVYRESTDALYNLDFSTAQSGFEGLTREHPENPDYWNALASSIWLKVIYDQQKLNMESFSNNESFGTRDSRETLNPADERRLRETLSIAMTKADAILKKN